MKIIQIRVQFCLFKVNHTLTYSFTDEKFRADFPTAKRTRPFNNRNAIILTPLTAILSEEPISKMFVSASFSVCFICVGWVKNPSH